MFSVKEQECVFMSVCVGVWCLSGGGCILRPGAGPKAVDVGNSRRAKQA